MIIEIKRICAQNSGEEIRLTIEIREDEESQNREIRSLVITAAQYGELKPVKSVITEEFYDKLEEAHKIASAIKRSMSILAYGANSEKKLKLKLKQRGIDEESAQKAVEYVAEKGFINEKQDALRSAECCVRKNWGLRKIISYLFSKGYSEDVLRDVKLRLENDVDFSQVCRKCILSKCRDIPTDIEQKRKLFASLSRNGFTVSEIKEALSELGK